MTVQELSKKINVSNQAIYKWKKEGLNLSSDEMILEFLKKKNNKYVYRFNKKEGGDENNIEEMKKKKEQLKDKIDLVFAQQQLILFNRFGVIYSKFDMIQGANFMASIMDAMINGIPDMTAMDKAVFTKYRDNFIKAAQILA